MLLSLPLIRRRSRNGRRRIRQNIFQDRPPPLRRTFSDGKIAADSSPPPPPAGHKNSCVIYIESARRRAARRRARARPRPPSRRPCFPCDHLGCLRGFTPPPLAGGDADCSTAITVLRLLIRACITLSPIISDEDNSSLFKNCAIATSSLPMLCVM